MRKKPIYMRLLKIIGIGLLCILTLEVCARVDDWAKWDADFFEPYSADLLSTVDTNGFHSKPNAKYQKWSINSFGFRGKGITKEKPDDIIRVITIGASETFGLYESENMEFPAQIQTILDENKPNRYQVLNAAHAGMSIPRIIEYYKSWLKQFNADIIIYYPSPSYYLNNLPPNHKKLSPLNHSFITTNFRLLDKSKIAIKQFLPKELQTQIKKYLIARTIEDHPPNWVFENVPDERIQLFEKQLLELTKEVTHDNTKLIITTHINRISEPLSDLDQKYIIDKRMMYPRASEKCLIMIDSAINKVIRENANLYRINIIDLEKLIVKRPEYFADFSHFTDLGAYIVAEVLAEKLIELNYEGKTR